MKKAEWLAEDATAFVLTAAAVGLQLLGGHH